jgi:hypothetical protein
MARPRLEVNGQNAGYLPIGTLALPTDLVQLIRELAKQHGVAGLVRAALIKTYMPETLKDPKPVVAKLKPDDFNPEDF